MIPILFFFCKFEYVKRLFSCFDADICGFKLGRRDHTLRFQALARIGQSLDWKTLHTNESRLYQTRTCIDAQ